jgi:acyl-CoA reductase-like NAD-dependent aldehyde dehydrogenase
MSDHDTDLVAQLFQHPGWKILEGRVNAEVERRQQALVTLILRTDHPLSEAKVDKNRGIIEGIDIFLSEARKAGRAFERDKGGDTV